VLQDLERKNETVNSPKDLFQFASLKNTIESLLVNLFWDSSIQRSISEQRGISVSKRCIQTRKGDVLWNQYFLLHRYEIAKKEE